MGRPGRHARAPPACASRKRVRELAYNLKLGGNECLRGRLLRRELAAASLVSMDFLALAPPRLQQKRDEEQRKGFRSRHIVEGTPQRARGAPVSVARGKSLAARSPSPERHRSDSPLQSPEASSEARGAGRADAVAPVGATARVAEGGGVPSGEGQLRDPDLFASLAERLFPEAPPPRPRLQPWPDKPAHLL